jgi:hypothetical protein
MRIVAFITEAAPVARILNPRRRAAEAAADHARTWTAGLGRGDRAPAGLGRDGTA